MLAGHTKFSVDQFIISVHVADVYTQKVLLCTCCRCVHTKGGVPTVFIISVLQVHL